MILFFFHHIEFYSYKNGANQLHKSINQTSEKLNNFTAALKEFYYYSERIDLDMTTIQEKCNVISNNMDSLKENGSTIFYSLSTKISDINHELTKLQNKWNENQLNINPL